MDALKQCVMNAVQASFLDDAEKAKLAAGLKKEMKM
jgi:adenosine deaminase